MAGIKIGVEELPAETQAALLSMTALGLVLTTYREVLGTQVPLQIFLETSEKILQGLNGGGLSGEMSADFADIIKKVTETLNKGG